MGEKRAKPRHVVAIIVAILTLISVGPGQWDGEFNGSYVRDVAIALVINVGIVYVISAFLANRRRNRS